MRRNCYFSHHFLVKWLLFTWRITGPNPDLNQYMSHLQQRLTFKEGDFTCAVEKLCVPNVHTHQELFHPALSTIKSPWRGLPQFQETWCSAQQPGWNRSLTLPLAAWWTFRHDLKFYSQLLRIVIRVFPKYTSIHQFIISTRWSTSPSPSSVSKPRLQQLFWILLTLEFDPANTIEKCSV